MIHPQSLCRKASFSCHYFITALIMCENYLQGFQSVLQIISAIKVITTLKSATQISDRQTRVKENILYLQKFYFAELNSELYVTLYCC